FNPLDAHVYGGKLSPQSTVRAPATQVIYGFRRVPSGNAPHRLPLLPPMARNTGRTGFISASGCQHGLCTDRMGAKAPEAVTFVTQNPRCNECSALFRTG